PTRPQMPGGSSLLGDRVRIHDLWHTTATLLLRSAVPPVGVRKGLGHRRMEWTHPQAPRPPLGAHSLGPASPPEPPRPGPPLPTLRWHSPAGGTRRGARRVQRPSAPCASPRLSPSRARRRRRVPSWPPRTSRGRRGAVPRALKSPVSEGVVTAGEGRAARA